METNEKMGERTEGGDTTQEFIEWVEKLGVAHVMALVAQACDVETEMAPSDALGAEWTRQRKAAEKLAAECAKVEERCRAHRRWQSADPSRRIQGPFIGMVTTYLDGEWPTMRGALFVIEGVFKTIEGSDHAVCITDNAELNACGGVSARDRIDVREVRRDGSRSFVSSEAYALDFECFAALRAPTH